MMAITFFIFLLIFGSVCCEIPNETLAYLYNHPETSQPYRQLILRYAFEIHLNKCLQYFTFKVLCKNKEIWFAVAHYFDKKV